MGVVPGLKIEQLCAVAMLTDSRADQIESGNPTLTNFDPDKTKVQTWMIDCSGRQIVCVPGSTADDCFQRRSSRQETCSARG